MKTRLPPTRSAIVHRFKIGGMKGYLNIGLYEDGRPAELFLKMDKSRFSGLTTSLGVMISMALQWGVPVEDISNKLMHMRFDPSGPTSNPQIPIALSISDYIGKFLKIHFVDEYVPKTTTPVPGQEAPA